MENAGNSAMESQMNSLWCYQYKLKTVKESYNTGWSKKLYIGTIQGKK